MSLLKHAKQYLANQSKYAHLNAFVSLADPSKLLSRSQAACNEPHDVRDKPVAIKDNICTHDLNTTASSNILKDFTSPYDATVVKLLRDAGAVVTGKTNMDEFGMGSHSTHSHIGPVRLQRDVSEEEKSAGGSSGGSALAVASAQSWAALGTDTGGSVRLPAAYTGVVGFKPSYGLLSRWGVIAYANSLDTVGILGKNVGDVEAIFDRLNVHDSQDPTSLPNSTRARLGKNSNRPTSLRIGIPLDYNIATLQPAVRQAWLRTLRSLWQQGHSLHPIRLPATQHALSAYYILAPAEASSNLAKYDGVRFGSRAEGIDGTPESVLFAKTRGNGFGSEVQRRILLGAFTLSAQAIDNYFIQAQKVRRLVQQDFNKIAFYFAFTQSYFTFLIPAAGFGAFAWLFLGHFSPIYALFSALWCVIFTEYWKHQEGDLSVRWGVKGVSKIDVKRRDFQHEKTITDPVTGEEVGFFPASTRFRRQLLQVPFAIAATLMLGTVIATCFGIEVFISEVYNGPLKSVLVFIPTGILTTVNPVLNTILTRFATKLTEFENYETASAFDYALTQKIFVLNFIMSYLGIFLTAFVYVPFGTVIVPYLDVFNVAVRPFAEDEKQLHLHSTTGSSGWSINPDRLRKQVIYFTVTAQVVNLGMELIIPYLKRRGLTKYKEMQSERAAKNGGAAPSAAVNDPPEDAAFLERVRKEAELDVYDVTADLREMVVQFGYLSLFSVVWPLTAVSFLINNWIELRADAMKICVEMQRPIPWRADTIGPWLDSLSFLTWLGTLTTSALAYMFYGDGKGPDGNPSNIQLWALLLSVFFAEHIFILVRTAVRIAISKMDTPGQQKERRERYLIRKQFFEENLSQLQKFPSLSAGGEEITRKSLEEDARQSSLRETTDESRFWSRQRGWKESASVGKNLIERAAIEASPERKKEL